MSITRTGTPQSFGWHKVLVASDRELWETPCGHQYWLPPGVKLERSPDPISGGYFYEVID